MAERSNPQSLVGMVGRLFETGLYSDLAILVGEEQFRFNVHKNIVAGRSSVFGTMLEKRWMEQSQGHTYTEEEGKIIVHLPKHGVEAFHIFLQYLYTDELQIEMDEDTDLCLELLDLSHFYDVPKLQGEIILHAKSRIGVHNCCDVYTRTKHIDPTLSEKSFQFLLQNIKYLGKHKHFLSYDYETMEAVLSQDVLEVREVDLFKALIKWGNHAPDTYEDRPRSTVLPQLLKMIRYPVIGNQDFATEVVPTGILSKDESLDMFLYFANPEKSKTTYVNFPRTRKLDKVGSPALKFPVDTARSRISFHIMEKASIENFPAELGLKVSHGIYLSGIVVNSSDIFQLIQHPQTVTFQLLVKDGIGGKMILREETTQRLTPPSKSLNLEIIYGLPLLLNPNKLYNLTVKCTTNTVYGGPLDFSREKLYHRTVLDARKACKCRIHECDVTAVTFASSEVHGTLFPGGNYWIRDLLFSPVQEVDPPVQEPCIIS